MAVRLVVRFIFKVVWSCLDFRYVRYFFNKGKPRVFIICGEPDLHATSIRGVPRVIAPFITEDLKRDLFQVVQVRHPVLKANPSFWKDYFSLGPMMLLATILVVIDCVKKRNALENITLWELLTYRYFGILLNTLKPMKILGIDISPMLLKCYQDKTEVIEFQHGALSLPIQERYAAKFSELNVPPPTFAVWDDFYSYFHRSIGGKVLELGFPITFSGIEGKNDADDKFLVALEWGFEGSKFFNQSISNELLALVKEIASEFGNESLILKSHPVSSSRKDAEPQDIARLFPGCQLIASLNEISDGTRIRFLLNDHSSLTIDMAFRGIPTLHTGSAPIRECLPEWFRDCDFLLEYKAGVGVKELLQKQFDFGVLRNRSPLQLDVLSRPSVTRATEK